jgi:adenosylmethionine-8-amino-7-oxononanoate aminotransferase
VNRQSKKLSLAQLDHKYVWHPFTQMRDWLKSEPIVITSGKGSVLRDVNGREYLDANSSIWTNLHGHNHPKINGAIHRQLKKIAHSSALGFANEPASLVAGQLVKIANPKKLEPHLGKVFFSDDGSTAMEVALKLAYSFARRTGRKQPKFLSLDGAYHGDTVGGGLGGTHLFVTKA